MSDSVLTAIIVGANGQDGTLLTEYLNKLSYTIHRITRDDIDISNANSVNRLVSQLQPREIYFLASYHHSSEDALENDGVLLRKSLHINVASAVNFLDAIANFSPRSRFFYASSCLIYAATNDQRQTENTVFSPETPYAISKVAGMNACQYYKNKKGIFACSGILYNHESPLRSPRFVSRKIVQAAVRISNGSESSLTLGSLDARVDWGYAPDFVVAMHKMLQMDKPEDFIIATGVAHSVREFTELAFRYLGLNYLSYVFEDPNKLSRNNFARIGDPSRIRTHTGWKPAVSFEQMVKLMVEAELRK